MVRHGKPEIFNTDQGSQFTGYAFTGCGKPVESAKRGDHAPAYFLSFVPVFDDLEIGVVSADFAVTRYGRMLVETSHILWNEVRDSKRNKDEPPQNPSNRGTMISTQ